MQIVRHRFKSYLRLIENSVGSNMFRNFYATIDGVLVDTMEDGKVSCAFFVSSVLTICGALESPSFVVGSVVNKLEKFGWKKVKQPKPGDVLLYEEKLAEGDSRPTPHIGFYVGSEKAISNSSQLRHPIKHDWLYRESGGREIVAIYTGKHLFKDDIKVVNEDK